MGTGAHGDGFERLSDRVESELGRRPAWIRLARVGWVAKGLVYATIAAAAILIAVDDRAAPEREAGYTGFVSILVGDPWTRAGLVVVAAGLLLYVAYRFVSVALIDGHDMDAWSHRVGYLISAMTYLVIAFVSVRAALEGTLERNEHGLVESTSRELLALDGGRVALAVAGVSTCGVAVYFAAKGVRRTFVDELDLDGDHPLERSAVILTGAVGWVGRGVLLAVIGAFVTWAAATANPDEARGLDRSLHRLADSDPGRLTVMAIGVLLTFYAAFCILSARHQDPAWTSKPS